MENLPKLESVYSGRETIESMVVSSYGIMADMPRYTVVRLLLI